MEEELRELARQVRFETIRGLANFFNASVHHVWSNEEIAGCLNGMIEGALAMPLEGRGGAT